MKDVRRDVDAEIRTHLDLHTAWLIQRGVPPEDARREAEWRFGSLAGARARLHRAAERRARTRRRRAWRDDLRQDLRFAARTVRRNPALTLIAVAILGLGIGLNAAVFSVFESVVLRPLPYRDPGSLVVIWRTPTTHDELLSASFDTYRDAEQWTADSHSFRNVAAATWAVGQRIYRPTDGAPRWVEAIPASLNFFDLLGVQPWRGRTFARDDLERRCTAVLSHRFWRSIGADSSLVGHTLTIDGGPCTVVGIMSPTFEFYPRHTDLWTVMRPPIAADENVGVFARLRSGVTMAMAQRELREMQARSPGPTALEREFVPSVFDLHAEFTWLAGRNLHLTVVVLLAAVGLVLIIACVNVAHLLIGRAAARDREFAVRVALGSGRNRLTRQLLAESGLLAGLGVAFGLAIALFAMRYIDSASFLELPPGADARLDLPVTAALAVMGMIATMIVGLMPAWRAARVDAADALKASSRGTTGRTAWLAGGLVVSEVTLSVALLLSAGLLVESLKELKRTPLGYAPEHLLTMRVSLASSDTIQRRRLYTDLALRPDAALTSQLPVNGSGLTYSVVVAGRGDVIDRDLAGVGQQVVSPAYFDVMHVPLVAGRRFGATDRAGAAPVAVVNRAFVRRYFPAESPLGQRIRLGTDTVAAPWLTVIGVIGDEQRAVVSREMGWVSAPMAFLPLAQAPPATSMYMVAGPTAGALDAVRAANADAIVSDVASMPDLLERAMVSPRTRAQLLTLLAVLAFSLSVVGLYGLLSQLVVQQTREIGIRVALGAQRGQVVTPIVRRGMALTAAGVAAGYLLALPAGHAMRGLLYGVGPFDPTVPLFASIAFLATSVAASLIPARRAAAVDPVIALRQD